MSDDFDPVPPRYRGVWARRLLAGPGLHDDTSFVRWLQTARWHADLRVPLAARAGDAVPDPAAHGTRLALQQGFCGRTAVHSIEGVERCTWHRRHDVQPPRADPDAGRILFDRPDRMIEYGIHSEYEEVWERLPGSEGPGGVFAQPAGTDEPASRSTLLLVAGRYATLVRPRRLAWPADTTTVDTLSDVIRRHPSLQAPLLDFEISFGAIAGGRWTVERSTFPQREGSSVALGIRRADAALASIAWDGRDTAWRIVEWDGDDERLA